MNLTFSNSPDAPLRRLKLQSVTLAGGLALAIAAAAVAGGGWQTAGAGPASTAPRIARSYVTLSTHETPSVTYYVVSSQAEAEMATSLEEEGAMARSLAGSPNPVRRTVVLIASNAAEESSALDQIRDAAWSAEGIVVNVTDLRPR